MISVLTELRQWATTLPYWEQAALDKMVSGVQFTDSDYDELLQYLLEDANLAESTGQRPQLHFPKSVSIASQSPSGAVRLIKISNLQGVNALVPGQSLTFGPALTAIFGANASGKSGYARVLGCAGFTRGDKEVLPNMVREPSGAITIQSADIEIFDGTSNKVIHYQIGGQCPELASCYMFDSTSVQVHLTKSNTFSFSPAGLSYLTQLADVTDKVRKRLQAKIEEYSQPHAFGPMFQGESNVTELIANLGPETDLDVLRKMATLAPDEQKRIGELDIEIARLKSQDIPEQINELTQAIEDLENLAKRLREVENKLGDGAIAEIGDAVKVYLEKEEAAQHISVDQFKSEHFTQTGSDVWRRFIEAAKALADVEQTLDRPYPQADSHCLLCQQPLLPEARDLLLRLWAFLEGEAQARLEQALAALEDQRKALAAINLDFFDDESVSYRHLREHDKALLKKVITFVAVCHKRREGALGIITTRTVSSVPALCDSGVSEIEKIIKALKTRRVELEEKNPLQEIEELEKQLLKLRHRELLGQYLPQVEAYVQKRVWAQQAAKVGGSTRHITSKYKELFSKLVTDRYIELFEQTLKDLQRPLKVEIQTRGRKGETYKQIVLSAAPPVSVDKTTLDKVLSGGEKRAVALADFLTEVALDTTSSGIILDDPVISLDLEWRETIASILATEAKRRQVIVFTHDLPFLYFLKKYSGQMTVEIATHWIKRGDNDDRPGYVFPNNSPALEQDYRTATMARGIYQQARNAAAEEQQRLLRQGFGALRAAYEAFIIFDLFNKVVMRFDERVSFGRLKDIIWDKSIVDEVNDKCELLSRYIEGHLHSDAFAAKKPNCKMLIEEIEAFDALRKKLKKLKAK